jgi:hypothetical protein
LMKSPNPLSLARRRRWLPLSVVRESPTGTAQGSEGLSPHSTC